MVVQENINTLHLCKRIVNKTVLKPSLNRHFDDNFLTDYSALRWRDNERDGVSNHQPHDCLLSRLFRHRSKKASKLRVTGLCVENSLVTSEFPAQRSSNAENVSIWWRHHGLFIFTVFKDSDKTFVNVTTLEFSNSIPRPLNAGGCKYVTDLRDWWYISIATEAKYDIHRDGLYKDKKLLNEL